MDVLSGALSRATIFLGKKGIFIRKRDANNNIMFDVDLPRSKFRDYRCRKEMYVSLNLKHLQKMIRNVKKKDSMIIFLAKNNRKELGFAIRPESAAQKSNRSETAFVSIQIEDSPEQLGLPEICETDDGVKDVYKYPMIIGATDFQKIKKLVALGREITVRMQKNNYISFYCGAGIYSTMLEFGEIVNDPETDTEPENEEDVEEGIDADTEEVVGNAPEAEQEESSSESETESEDSDSDEELPGWYEARFYTSIIGLLVKLPGLCSQMQFYAPRYGYPLKIEMDAATGNSTLGTIRVYIKDIDMIESEEKFSQNGVQDD